MSNKIIKRMWRDEDNNSSYKIRFVEIDGVYWAILKDICDALGLKTKHVSARIPAQFLLKKSVPMSDTVSTDLRQGECRNRIVTLVNEYGIYLCISGSRKVEARKFKLWYPSILSELRKGIGLKEYQAMDMMNEDVQKHITKELKKVTPDFDPYSDIYYDEERGMLMRSVTVAGGDVEQIPYEGDGSDIPDIYKLYC